MYVYEAIGDMAPILRASFDGKPRKPIEYPAEPYAMDAKELRERKVREERKRAEAAKAIFAAKVNRINAQLESKGVNDNGQQHSNRTTEYSGSVECGSGSEGTGQIDAIAGQAEGFE